MIHSSRSILILSLVALVQYATAQTGQAPALTPVGTHGIVGKLDGLDIEAMVQSPSNESTPLQVVCLFEYTENDIYTSPPALPAAANGMVHVDQQLHGLITELRKSGRFRGHALETLLITPPPGAIKAKRLLLIGLGSRNHFSAGLMVDVGRVGMRAALSLGVTSYAHASDLKDGGLDSPTGEVATNVIKGAMDAYETELFLQKEGMTSKKPLVKLTLLAGQPFYEPSVGSIKEFITHYKN
jgi:hypothetical protein